MDSFPNATRRSKPATSVSFESTARVYKIRHINNFSREEIQSSWYNATELACIKAECVATLHMIMEGKPFDSSLYCVRGLEFRTPDGLEQRQLRRSAARNAVFTVQEDAWRKTADKSQGNMLSSSLATSSTYEIEAFMISYVYQKYSGSCQDAAHQQGITDAQATIQTAFASSEKVSVSRGYYSGQRSDDGTTSSYIQAKREAAALPSSSSSRWGGTTTSPKRFRVKNLPPKFPHRFTPRAA